MAELNKVLMIGRLTRDPELRYTPGGLPVADFRLASNHTYRTKEEKREEVCYIDVNLLGRTAEVAKEYLSKGREVLVEGRLKLENWETKEGEKRSTYRIVADRFQFIGGRESGGGDGGGGGARRGGYDAGPPRHDEAAAGGSGSGGGGGASHGGYGGPPQQEQDDELPF